MLEQAGDGWRSPDRSDTRWLASYYLTSSASGTPRWWSVGDDAAAWEDLDVEGAGPETLVLPPDLDSSVPWRLCTMSSTENVWAALGVQ